MNHPLVSIARLWILVCTACVIVNATLQADDTKENSDFFESRVRPLLIERCVECHGEKKQWGELRLDIATGFKKGGENGPIAVAGSSDTSPIIQRVSSTDASIQMPPPDSGPRLTPDQIDALKTWIDRGAVWPASSAPHEAANNDAARTHWAYLPMRMTAPPELSSKQSTDKSQSAVTGINEVDSFVFSKLIDNGLSPSQPADRRTLIRRATYDLTGLPPTPEQVAQFIADTSPDAYEKLIDRLLDSPQYAEHWARHWLDIARFSDTKGYVYAREERFYIHSAGYRDWVIQSLQNDLPYNRFVMLQLVADQLVPENSPDLSAMGFLTLGRRFLGVTPDIIDDRIDVVGRGLLGLTIGCARCHDHKYDPIPTTDYYSLYGVFQNSLERTVVAGEKDGLTSATSVSSVDAENADSPAMAEYRKGLADRQKVFDDLFNTQKEQSEQRFRKRLAEYLAAQRELEKYPELTFSQLSTKDDLLPAIVHRWELFLANLDEDGQRIFGLWNALATIPDAQFESQATSICQSLLQHPSQVHPMVAAAFSTPPRSIQEAAQKYGILFEQIEEQWTTHTKNTIESGATLPIAFASADEESLRQVLFGPDSPCVIPRDDMSNIEWYWDTNTVVELWQKHGEIDRWILQHPDQAKRTIILADANRLVAPRVFKRGNPANKGAKIPRQFLTVASAQPRKPFEHGSGRLEMAQQIVRDDNPLTARVWVNRVWQKHFGKGLVDSPSDFGLRTAPPSHPELLDWLAMQFIQNGWSNRWLHRTMMLSATYRQSSSGSNSIDTFELAQRVDPDNRLLWRMNPRRLTFEELRDTLLVASAELNTSLGGKASDMFSPGAGGGFRRSIYGLIDRQYLPTVFNVFDFANPDLHSPQRSETTVPQQALFQLNNPFIADRARKIAKRSLGDNSADSVPANQRINALFQLNLQRDATEAQLEASRAFLSPPHSTATESQSSHRRDWSYGYGELDECLRNVKAFHKLPYSNSVNWQGGPQLPDGALGWVHISAKLIHAGNDLKHSAIRRWTAPRSGKVSVKSIVSHEHSEGDGARAVVISSRHGQLHNDVIYNSTKEMSHASLEVHAGDTIDFIVQLHGSLSYEDLAWAPTLTLAPSPENVEQITTIESPTNTNLSSVTNESNTWDAAKDFQTSTGGDWGPWEQLTHVLMLSNECYFLD